MSLRSLSAAVCGFNQIFKEHSPASSLRGSIYRSILKLAHDIIEVRDVIEPQIAFLANKNATEEDVATIWAGRSRNPRDFLW